MKSGPLTSDELAQVEESIDNQDTWLARMLAEIRAHRQTLVSADDLIIAARQLDNADLGRLRRAVEALSRETVEDTVQKLITQAVALPDIQLGALRRFVNSEFEARIRFTKGLTESEQQLLAESKLIDCVKAVRERTGLGLADAKELIDRWKSGERQ